MSMEARRFAKTWVRNERGNVGIMFGMFALPAFLLAGGAYDFGHSFNTKRKVQAAADAAVLAAANMPYGTENAAREAQATNIFNANTAGMSGITAVPTANGNSISLAVTGQVPTVFLKLAHIDNMDFGANASAAVSYQSGSTSTTTDSDGGAVCLLALDPGATTGFISQGTPTVNYDGCWAHTNSTSATAIDGGGSGSATGAGHSAVGSVTESAKDVYSPDPVGGKAVINDPFATVSAYAAPTSSYQPTFNPPSVSGDCKASNLNLKKGTFTLDPGRYCGGIKLQAHATVTLNPGEYIMDNGALIVQSGSSLTGSDVLFYFSGANSTMTVIGGGTINLKGRTSGSSDLKGMLFVAHPDAGRGMTTNIQGGGNFTMEGMLYMPTQNIIVTGNGNSNSASNVFAMVAKSFEFRGNGVFRYKPWNAASNMPDILPRRTVPVVTTTNTQVVSKVLLK